MPKYWEVPNEDRKCDTCKHQIQANLGTGTKCEYFPPCVGFPFKWEPRNPEQYADAQSFEVDEPEQYHRFGTSK